MQNQNAMPTPDDGDAYIKKMELVINKTIPGLTMFVRDINLPVDIAKKYEPGLIIREKAYVDASHRVMGMITTHRFAILSNHMANFESYEHGTNWGLCVANRDSRFKILAQHEYSGKTLILLLHLPDDDDWKMFQNVVINIEEDMIATSKERFENKCNLEPVPELTTEEWLQRCSFPIGLDDSGDFFDLE
jgi:hypothetical protein